jgi:hypothetical protein
MSSGPFPGTISFLFTRQTALGASGYTYLQPEPATMLTESGGTVPLLPGYPESSPLNSYGSFIQHGGQALERFMPRITGSLVGVPEPSVALVLTGGLLALVAVSARRKRWQAAIGGNADRQRTLQPDCA